MLLHFALVLHFAAIVITFCGDYYILRRNSPQLALQRLILRHLNKGIYLFILSQGPLTPTNYDSLVSMAATEITTQLETSVMKASFNRVSCQ